MLRIFCHGIPFFPIQKINLFSHENVQYDKPCCTDDNMDGECMDQSCAWKQPCEYVVATTMTYHDLVTLTAMNTIRTIVIIVTRPKPPCGRQGLVKPSEASSCCRT